MTLKALLVVCQHGRPTTEHEISIGSLLKHERKLDLDVSWLVDTNACIDKRRSVQASKFMLDSKDGDVLVFVDSDIAFNGTAFKRLVEKCYSTKAIVGAAYPSRVGEIRSLVDGFADGSRVFEFGDDKPLVTVEYLPAGFLAIHRNALVKIVKALNLEMILENMDGYFYPLFFPIIAKDGNDLRWLSEDYSFSHRCKLAGVEMFLDQSIYLQHVGEKAYDMYNVKNAIVGEKHDNI